MEEVTAKRARTLLDYDPGTGVLRWRMSRGGRARVGDVAGCIRSDGYWRIQVGGRKYLAHRIIFLMQTGRWPHEIDHINGIRGDNRWTNLREVNNQANARNQRRYCNNTSGCMGVGWDKSISKWMASIKLNGGLKYLGHFRKKADAIAARKTAESEYGFHSNHGRAALSSKTPILVNHKQKVK